MSTRRSVALFAISNLTGVEGYRPESLDLWAQVRNHSSKHSFDASQHAQVKKQHNFIKANKKTGKSNVTLFLIGKYLVIYYSINFCVCARAELVYIGIYDVSLPTSHAQ